MKRQYIDFIPYNDNSTSPLFTDEISPVEKKSYASVFEKPAPKLGVVEDVSYDDSFRYDDEADETASVSYRSYQVAPSLQSSKSENLSNKPLILRKPHTVAQPFERAKDLSGYHPPKVPFINTTVEKRPLSKNIYRNQVKPLPSLDEFMDDDDFEDEKPKKIEKPAKKDDLLRVVDEPKKKSHGGIIFAIIMSILLGTAAGVIIYLFFP